MQTQTVMKTALLALTAAFVLAGCAESGGKFGRGGKTTPPPQGQTPATTTTGKEEIAYLTFSLPEQVQWQQNNDEALDQAGVAEWYVNGTSPQTSPARVMYQKLMPAQAPAAVRAQVLQPLQNCPDSQVNTFRTSSKYREQLNIQSICSKFGEADFGLINYVSIFSDGVANHMVVTEVRTPASEKAGVLNFKNAETQRWADTSKTLSELMHNTMQTIRACDSKNACF